MNTDNEPNATIKGLLTYLYKNGYRFPNPDGTLQSANPNNVKKDLLASGLIAAGVGYCFGLVGVLSLGGNSESEDVLKSDLDDIAICGLFAGFKTDCGLAYVALIVDCTDLSDEILAGKLSVITEKLKNFQKYSLRTSPQLRFIKNDTRNVFGFTYFIFTEKARADHFLVNIWGKLFKPKFFTHLHVMPVVIDVSTKKLFKYKGALRGGFSSENEYSKIFS